MHDSENEQRLVVIRSEIARRITPVCNNLSSDEFESLVDRMAWVRYKYETRLPISAQPTDDPSSASAVDPS